MDIKKELEELAIADKEKQRRAYELVIANREKQDRSAELVFANEEKAKRVAELVIANEVKARRIDELIIADEEKAKRVAELVIANEEKQKRADELVIANVEKQNRVAELVRAYEDKEKRAAELVIALQEKAKREAELVIADEEKKKRVEELMLAHNELQQLLQFNNDKNLFISILAHDMKSPFTVILGYTELLLDNICKNDIKKIEFFANEIHKSTNEAFALLDDLFKWGRVQSGRISFELIKINPSHICNDILKLLNPLAHTRNITIINNIPSELFVLADSDMFQVIIRNLVSNSIKFTNNDGTITINAAENSGIATFSVSDNGIGIEPDRIKKLFTIANHQTTRDLEGEKGTGLGLVLCKEFVEKHGGTICLTSESGKGTEVKFTLQCS